MSIPFHLERPCKTYKLPKKYKEASGICLVPNTQTLAFVQDEHVRVFHLDLDSEEIRKTQKFHAGDAEDLAIIENTALVLAAGPRPSIYRIEDYAGQDPRIERIDLGLGADDDPEGLCHDPPNNRLLIACKGSRRAGDRTRRVHEFDLEARSTDATRPLFAIDSDAIGLTDQTFHPSGIDIDPITGDIYLVGTKDVKMLVCCDQEGTVKSTRLLNKERFEQPEGLAFTPSGELFICSEGKSKKARIHRFSPSRSEP